MNKQMLTGIALVLLIMPVVPALELVMRDENGKENIIFSPGSTVVFSAKVSDEVNTVTLVILKDSKPVLTDRMKVFSLKPKEFAYGYKIEEDMEQGDYIVKILAKGNDTESMSTELYIGEETQLSFVEPENESIPEEKPSFFQKIWEFIKNLFAKNE